MVMEFTPARIAVLFVARARVTLMRRAAFVLDVERHPLYQVFAILCTSHALHSRSCVSARTSSMGTASAATTTHRER